MAYPNLVAEMTRRSITAKPVFQTITHAIPSLISSAHSFAIVFNAAIARQTSRQIFHGTARPPAQSRIPTFTTAT